VSTRKGARKIPVFENYELATPTGGELFRPSLTLIFWSIYGISGFVPGVLQSGLAAVEITLLVGYTKYASLQAPMSVQIAFAANMVFGLWWYTVFVPTIVNRVSRSK
jgi:hypothetical protein